MATQLDPTTFGYQNFYSALLTADITAVSLTIALDTVPSPTAGILVIDPDSSTAREVILYTSKGASTITCPSDGRGWDSSTATAHLQGTTVIMADVAYYFKKLASGELSTDNLRTESFFDFIVSNTGIVAISSGLVGTFSNITFYLNGRRYVGSSIPNKTYTASKDTYVDVTGASDGTVSVLYTEVANNATSPALSTNYVRVAIVVTSGAAITSVNQGSWGAATPVVSSQTLERTDSLGNLVYPTDPRRLVLGGFTAASVSAIGGITQLTNGFARIFAPAGGANVTVICDIDAFGSTANLAEFTLKLDGSSVKTHRLPMNGTGGWTQQLSLTYMTFLSAGAHNLSLSAALAAGTGTITVANAALEVFSR